MGSLLEEFNVKVKTTDLEVNDYNIFEDKGLMDGFRIQILELLSDRGFTGRSTPKSVINELNSVVGSFTSQVDSRIETIDAQTKIAKR